MSGAHRPAKPSQSVISMLTQSPKIRWKIPDGRLRQRHGHMHVPPPHAPLPCNTLKIEKSWNLWYFYSYSPTFRRSASVAIISIGYFQSQNFGCYSPKKSWLFLRPLENTHIFVCMFVCLEFFCFLTSSKLKFFTWHLPPSEARGCLLQNAYFCCHIRYSFCLWILICLSPRGKILWPSAVRELAQ